jgi:hypothetical protein
VSGKAVRRGHSHRAVLALMVMTILLAITASASVAWAHSAADELEKQAVLIAIAVVIAFVALIWGLASRDEKRRGRRQLRDLPRKRGSRS